MSACNPDWPGTYHGLPQLPECWDCRGISVPPSGRRSADAGAAISIVVTSSRGPVRRKPAWASHSEADVASKGLAPVTYFCHPSPLLPSKPIVLSSGEPSLQDINIPDSNSIILPKFSSEPRPSAFHSCPGGHTELGQSRIWRGGSAGTGCCLCTEPGFGSQHPRGNSQPTWSSSCRGPDALFRPLQNKNGWSFSHTEADDDLEEARHKLS